MINDTERRIVRLRNEIKALKSSQLLSGGYLAINNLSVHWEDNIHIDEVIIREVTFKRTDGIKMAPLVEFSYAFENPEDFEYGNRPDVVAAICRVGEDSVTYRVVCSGTYLRAEGIVKISVLAYSMVNGELNLRRIK